MKDLLIKRFLYYKNLGDQTFKSLNDHDITWKFNEESNSIATIVKHVSGNMLSRWTNFLTEDGEKDWRKRDQEFENDIRSKSEMLELWKKGWAVLNVALEQLTDENLHSTILIRGEKHSVLDALLRQLAHYPYHIGQIIYIAKMLQNENWETLSIARNKSAEFNKEMLASKSLDQNENASPVCFEKSDEVRKDYRN